MHMDKNANINFVNKFEISQFFKIEGQNKFLPEKNIIICRHYLAGYEKDGDNSKKNNTI